jgi:D-glycero-D-manno-heptose 1,7-bisphosphate phosphatase
MNDRLLLLALDGTIREPKSGAKFINNPEDQRLITGASEAIARYARQGWEIAGITNQGGVAAGYKTLQDAILEQRITQGLLPKIEPGSFMNPECPLQEIYFCPDEGLTCWCVPYGRKAVPMHDREWRATEWMPEPPSQLIGHFRKPGAGMLKLRIQRLAYGEILYVGDREEDEQAAQAAGIPFQWAREWRG